MAEESVVVASRNHLASQLGDEIVILDLDDGTYYGLNPLAAFVWELVQDPVSVEDIHLRILDEYEVDSGSARTDLLQLLHDLERLGLVDAYSPATTPSAS